jgi:hypothetical protein
LPDCWQKQQLASKLIKSNAPKSTWFTKQTNQPKINRFSVQQKKYLLLPKPPRNLSIGISVMKLL